MRAVAPVLLLVVSSTLRSTAALPNGHAWGCLPGNVSAHLPFCDASLPTDVRVNDLVSRLTVDEKAGLLSADSRTQVNNCNFMDHGVPRFGIPPYMHLVETNSAVASTCLNEHQCSTNWPGPTGLGATFNRSLWRAKGEVMSDEMRAFNNLEWYRATADAPHSLIGLNGYGPNMNIVRDPRFGRNSELPGEDPFLTGTYAKEMVRAAQGLDAYESGGSKYLKMTMGLKHFDLYSVEEPRASFIPNVTAHDLWETYLAQYHLGFSRLDFDGNPAGGAMGTMCSYAGLNGVPSCANNYLLNSVIRSKFGRPDVVVGTDCGAVSNMVNANHYASNNLDAAAKTINGGTDMELGDQFWAPKAGGGMGLLHESVSEGLVQLERVDESVRRVLNLRFVTGQFDPLEAQPYAKIGADVVNSTRAQQLNLEAALQSFVLLKNEQNTLPMASGKKTAILGPHIFSTRDLLSSYKGDEQCIGGPTDFSCFPTIAEAFTAFNGPDNTLVAQGVELDSTNTSGIPAALAAAQAADQVLIFIGIGWNQEHEGIDRHNISLPGVQEQFTLAVLDACAKHDIPAAVVLINGGALAIDPVVPVASAIVEAFYPSIRGAHALALALFGEANRWGKLPITIYDKEFQSLTDMYNFSMSDGPGRTYKYYSKPVLFPFGHGLSYSEFHLDCQQQGSMMEQGKAGPGVDIACKVSLQSGPGGDEVLMVFHSVGESIRSAAKHPVPKKELVGFERVHVGSAGDSAAVTFAIGPNQLGLVDENGDRQLIAGAHTIEITNGVDQSKTFAVTVEKGQARVLDMVPQFSEE